MNCVCAKCSCKSRKSVSRATKLPKKCENRVFSISIGKSHHGCKNHPQSRGTWPKACLMNEDNVRFISTKDHLPTRNSRPPRRIRTKLLDVHPVRQRSTESPRRKCRKHAMQHHRATQSESPRRTGHSQSMSVVFLKNFQKSESNPSVVRNFSRKSKLGAFEKPHSRKIKKMIIEDEIDEFYDRFEREIKTELGCSKKIKQYSKFSANKAYDDHHDETEDFIAHFFSGILSDDE